MRFATQAPSVLTLCIVALALCGGTLAQTPPSAPPSGLRFEVASIRPIAGPGQANADNPSFQEYQAGKAKSFCMICTSGNHYDAYGVSLKLLIAQAYRIDPRLIVGPEWLNRIDQAQFVVHAEIPNGSAKEQIPDMLQSLLAERFHLALHRGTTEQTAYALVAGGNGAKLKPPHDLNESSCSSWVDSPFKLPDGGASRICSMKQEEGEQTFTTTMTTNTATGPVLTRSGGQPPEIHTEHFRITMPQLADLLARDFSTGTTQAPMAGSIVKVTDKTGIEGAWDVVTEETPGDLALPTISASLEKQGLRLERGTATVETLVIDQIDKVPTEN